MPDPLTRTLLILTFVTGIVDVVSFLALGVAGAIVGALLLKASLALAITAAAAVVIAAAVSSRGSLSSSPESA